MNTIFKLAGAIALLSLIAWNWESPPPKERHRPQCMIEGAYEGEVC